MTLLRHQFLCNTARPQTTRTPFRIGPARVGWLHETIAEALIQLGLPRQSGAIVLPRDRASELPELARALAQAGHFRWRDEAFDVRVSEAAPSLATIDRGALPSFGLLSVGVHLNGLVRDESGAWHVWVGQRAADKALDPGKLDHLVAGGVPAGLSPWATLVKEAGEEASLAGSLLSRARAVARIGYAMERPEGLRRDVLLCYDLVLPLSFTPRPNDGEVAHFELWPIGRVIAAVRDTDVFKFNVALVMVNLFRRLGMIA